MVRTGDRYRDSIRDNRDVYINGERVNDGTTHPRLWPLVDFRARVHDMRQGEDCEYMMAHTETSETSPTGYKLPSGRDDWWAKRKGVMLFGPAETFPRIPPQPL